MAVVDATLCLPFKPAEQTVLLWKDSVLEACKRTSFLFEAEAEEVLAEIDDFLPPMLYARLLSAIRVDFGHAEVRYCLNYDALPEEDDQIDLDILDLVLEPPTECVITFTLADTEKAAFLKCLDLESYATEHVRLVVDALPAVPDAAEGDW